MNVKNCLKILISIIIVIFTIFFILILKIYYYANIDEAQKSDVIIVLGASQWNGNPSPVFKSRLDHAFFLYNNNMASQIILTGGVGKDEKISESQVGKSYLINKGVKSQNIFIEEVSQTSWQNLQMAEKILKNFENFHNNSVSVILVSDGFHMMRLKKMSKDLGIQVLTSPVQKSPIKNNQLVEFKYILRESLVYVLYLLFKI
ncbi:MAG: YdcF family protein [bacterium]|nr:YdcF family protein [bacterium]